MFVIFDQFVFVLEDGFESRVFKQNTPAHGRVLAQDWLRRELDSFIVKNSNRHLFQERKVDEAKLPLDGAYLRTSFVQFVFEVGQLLELQN